MTIREITSCLEEHSPLSLQESYDNSGLLIGDPLAEAQRVLITLDITEAVLHEAVHKKCQLIISHHPLIFHGLKRITGNDPLQRMVMHAIRNGISIYAIHTNLDNSFEGLNMQICRKLGLTNCSILESQKGLLSKLVVFCPMDHADKVRQSLFESGAGHIGNYDCCSYNIKGSGSFRALEKANPFVGKKNEIHFEEEVRIEVIYPVAIEEKIISAMKSSHPYEEVAFDLYPIANRSGYSGSGMVGTLEKEMETRDFLARVKQALGLQVLKHSKTSPSSGIKKVAVCTGSGSFLIRNAIQAGADAFLTADLKYHDYFETDDKLLLTDLGHYESECGVKDLIHDILIRKFPTFAFLVSDIDTNPVTYL